MTDLDLAATPRTGPVPDVDAVPSTATRPPRPDRSPRITDRPTLHRDADLLLPEPPNDAERDLYLGPQHRWIGPVSFLGYLLIVLSVCFFVWRHVWAAALLVPLFISTVGTCVSLVTSSRRRRDTLGSHHDRVARWAPVAVPSVDVFLPSAGEDLAVLHNTYGHVARLRWAGPINVYVLDDSGRDAVETMARAHGFHYLSRPDKGVFKKAGNLRYGFGHSDGDAILILDADFVPRPDALSELVPYLDDPDVGIVQSPQYFDADERMNWLQRAAGATQVLFYRWVQPSRDRSRAAICVGTSAVYRRAALEQSGGYALIGHSEDVHTGVNMMRAGYHVRYVPTIVTKGLCPDTFDQFLTQQYRWCTGSMSLLFSKGFHAIRLTTMQRLSYWSGFLYYITTGVNVFAMALPSILMGWFVADRVSPANYVFVLLAMVGRQAIVPVITLERESLVGLARIQTTYSFCHAVALFDVLRGRTDAWVATGAKGRSRTSDRVRRLMRWWCLAVQVLLWSAIAVHAPVYGWADYSLMIVFALLNLYVVYPLVLGRVDVPTFSDLRVGRLSSSVGHTRAAER
jgi:cellulose synthase (UDP-forming)